MTSDTLALSDPDPTDPPRGCLGCNEKEVAEVLAMAKIDRNLITEVPRPRHNWGDVICCEQCGRAWLINRSPVPRISEVK